MRIAVVTSAFPVLSQTFVLNQITAFIDAGHDVTILADRPADTSTVHPNVDAYSLQERTIYWGRKEKPSLTGRVGEKLELLKSAKVARVGSGLWKGRRALSPLRPAATLRRIRRAAYLSTTPAFDAIVCHFGTTALECQALREMGALRGPLITVFHGYDMSMFLKEKGDDVYDELLQKGELFLPISDHWRRRLLEMGAADERTIVHHMGIDPERFSMKVRSPDADGEIRILSIGRFVEKKGFESGIRAFAEIADEFEAVRYTIVGDGVLRPGLEVLANELGVANRVDFLGWADRDVVIEMLYEHQILMVPSQTASTGDMEGIPVVLMEGMATGIPVISTRHSGIPELVRHEESGLLADEGAVDQLANHLRTFLDEPDSWATFGTKGREIVEEGFSLHDLNRRLIELVETGIIER